MSITKGCTNLFKAIIKGKHNRIKELAKSANITSVDPTTGFSYLHTAAHENQTKCLTELIKLGFDINQQIHDQRTPLHVAAERGNVQICILLLANKSIQPNKLNREGHTPLFSAIFNDRFECFELLLNHFLISLSVVNDEKNNILHLTCKENLYKYLPSLLATNIGLNKRNRYGNTALHISALRGHSQCVAYLLSRGAAADIKNDKNCTARDLANLKAFADIVKIIDNFVADTSITPIKSKLKRSLSSGSHTPVPKAPHPATQQANRQTVINPAFQTFNKPPVAIQHPLPSHPASKPIQKSPRGPNPSAAYPNTATQPPNYLRGPLSPPLSPRQGISGPTSPRQGPFQGATSPRNAPPQNQLPVSPRAGPQSQLSPTGALSPRQGILSPRAMPVIPNPTPISPRQGPLSPRKAAAAQLSGQSPSGSEANPTAPTRGFAPAASNRRGKNPSGSENKGQDAKEWRRPYVAYLRDQRSFLQVR